MRSKLYGEIYCIRNDCLDLKTIDSTLTLQLSLNAVHKSFFQPPPYNFHISSEPSPLPLSPETIKENSQRKGGWRRHASLGTLLGTCVQNASPAPLWEYARDTEVRHEPLDQETRVGTTWADCCIAHKITCPWPTDPRCNPS